MVNQVKCITIVIILLTTLTVDCIPVSPCPMNFHYEFDGQQWIGIAIVYPQFYNRFHSDRITMNLWLAINRPMPSMQNLKLLQLKKSLQETYQDIAERRPIQYRISFPFRNNLPVLMLINVNDVQLCRNAQIFHTGSRIELKYTIFLSSVESEEQQFDDYDVETSLKLISNAQEPDVSSSMIEEVVTTSLQEEANQRNKHPRLQKASPIMNSQCGKYDEDLKYTQLISGGNRIKPGTWPWLVAIFHKDSKASNLVFLCTGNLISNRLVLTAAHCFKSNAKSKPAAAREFVLAFGQHDIRDWTEKNMELSNVEKIIVHPDYLSKTESKIFDADIAVLITKKFISYTSKIRPICLWPSSVDGSHSLIGSNGTLVGWGQPHENIDENVPRRLMLPIVRNSLCFPSDRSSNVRRVLCAGTRKRGYAPCNGDSGSALAIFVNNAWFVRGLVSAALGDPILNQCDLNTYTIFTDILHFRPWIDSHM